ncbi:hypothetical protein L1049_018149 [Liquidambar formosana]|uniref:Myb-like domain-containing protein n=1 Tax=Liquidambar formosana TaxID=63359 RepID=A0AAP0NIB3_LIQFO
MQSGYGASEIYHHHHQHFMAGDCNCLSSSAPSSAFSLSNPQKQNHPLLPYDHPHQYQYQHQHQHQHQHIAVTHQLFQHPHHFQAFQQAQRLHHSEPGVDTVGDCDTPRLPFFTVNFKLGLNENNGSREAVSNEEEKEYGFFRGNEQHFPEGRPNSLVMPPHCLRPQEDSAIKEPLWKPLSAELFNGNKYSKFSEQVNGNHQGKGLGKKYRHFGELEAIYGPAGIGETNQTGSASVLTAEDSPSNAGLQMPFDHHHNLNVTAAGASTDLIGVYHGSETSTGEEASLRKSRKRKRKRKIRDRLGSMGKFFERIVKQLMDHQEGLHRQFLGVIGKMEQQRIKREEAWRCEETAKYNREAIARAHEQALASCRETAIVSCLEKITGQSINFPSRKIQLDLQPQIPKESIEELRHNNTNSIGTSNNTNSRWPKAEVEALIRVRSSLELRFQEPGLKGPLWEEISSLMASIGYIRSAKRCKEKWENINKYFRKTKESAKKRSQMSKTCPYFEQLDQLYSRSLFTGSSSTSASYCSRLSVANDAGVQMRGNSELLEAIIVGNDDIGITQNSPIENFQVAEMGPLRLDFDGIVHEEMNVQHGTNEKQEYRGDEMDEGEDLEDNEEDDDNEEEVEEEGEESGDGDGGGGGGGGD